MTGKISVTHFAALLLSMWSSSGNKGMHAQTPSFGSRGSKKFRCRGFARHGNEAHCMYVERQ